MRKRAEACQACRGGFKLDFARAAAASERLATRTAEDQGSVGQRAEAADRH